MTRGAAAGAVEMRIGIRPTTQGAHEKRLTGLAPTATRLMTGDAAQNHPLGIAATSIERMSAGAGQIGAARAIAEAIGGLLLAVRGTQATGTALKMQAIVIEMIGEDGEAPSGVKGPCRRKRHLLP